MIAVGDRVMVVGGPQLDRTSGRPFEAEVMQLNELVSALEGRQAFWGSAPGIVGLGPNGWIGLRDSEVEKIEAPAAAA